MVNAVMERTPYYLPASLPEWLEKSQQLVKAIAQRPQDIELLTRGYAEQLVAAWPEQHDILLSVLQFYPSGYAPAVHWVTRCAVLTTAVAYQLKIHPRTVEQWVCAALTMDCSILDLINQLGLQGKLLRQHQQRWRQHPLQSMQLLRRAEITDRRWLQLVLHHQERVTGTGYPTGLQGRRVSFAVQVLNLISEFVKVSLPRLKTQTQPVSRLLYMLRQLARQPHQHREILRALVNTLCPLPYATMMRLQDHSLVLSTARPEHDQVAVLPLATKVRTVGESSVITVSDEDIIKIYPCLILKQQDLIERWRQAVISEPRQQWDWPEYVIEPTAILPKLREELSAEHPSMRLVAGIIEHSHLRDPILQAINRHRSARSKPVTAVKHALMLNGLDYAEPLIVRTELLYLLTRQRFNQLPYLLSLARQYAALCQALAAKSEIYYPHWVGVWALFQAAIVIEHEQWPIQGQQTLELRNVEGHFAEWVLPPALLKSIKERTAELAETWQLPEALKEALVMPKNSPSLNSDRAARRIYATGMVAQALLRQYHLPTPAHNSVKTLQSIPPGIGKWLQVLGLQPPHIKEVIEHALALDEWFSPLQDT